MISANKAYFSTILLHSKTPRISNYTSRIFAATQYGVSRKTTATR